MKYKKLLELRKQFEEETKTKYTGYTFVYSAWLEQNQIESGIKSDVKTPVIESFKSSTDIYDFLQTAVPNTVAAKRSYNKYISPFISKEAKEAVLKRLTKELFNVL